MGYDLHITRREDWSDTDVSDISIDEWLIYVKDDNELELTNGYDIKIGSETQYQNSPGFCEWTAHPTEQEPNSRPWFSYWKGSIDTKNPDTATIRKMMQIASALNAKVQGDDGEFYTEEYLADLVSDTEQKTLPGTHDKKPWWKFW
ncbi:MAG TPA: hypothetical protein VFI06_08865 [Chitinophagaceae bacterium]|nr:hypothetical protein [Chitinophagaceae bacterium]